MIPKQKRLPDPHFFISKRRGRRGRRAKQLQPGVDLRAIFLPTKPQKRAFARSFVKPIFRVLGVGSRITSRFFRKVFENPKIKTLVGANLAVVTILTGLVRSSSVLSFGVVPSLGTVSANHDISLTTKESVVKPMTNYQQTQGFSLFHPGVDFAVDTGAQVHPIMNGVVAESGQSIFGYGNTVVVDHQNGYSTRYAHFSKVLVHRADKVTTETVIGLSGSSGRSTGPHLHLEVYDHGMPVNPGVLLE